MLSRVRKLRAEVDGKMVLGIGTGIRIIVNTQDIKKGNWTFGVIVYRRVVFLFGESRTQFLETWIIKKN